MFKKVTGTEALKALIAGDILESCENKLQLTMDENGETNVSKFNTRTGFYSSWFSFFITINEVTTNNWFVVKVNK